MDKFIDNIIQDNYSHAVKNRTEKKDKKFIPTIESVLKKKPIQMPAEIYEASGINIFGKRIKSLIFTTDLAIIKNHNADGVIAVYPFTPQIAINQAIIEVSSAPVFVGVGGGITTGQRSIDIAINAELNGAYGVVMNAPTPNELISEMKQRLDIPIIITIVSEKEDFESRIKAGASIFNVSGGTRTASIARKIREKHPYFPIIATGGPNPENIMNTIQAGANTITFTPPTTGDLFSEIMDTYREKLS
ncbi:MULTISPECIES: hydrolase [unclassified Sedimentibacter]|uniref:hydrolase n=1 Tax=unclassified Sedimentibacter TaxID=2649220 RepID=UPI0027DFC97B|nr:hydrolase [Sedimentibacter sp. MB35-C1]WMJ76091.1 hydrolase [Sedimentibacter sp. MB35-C1]